MMKKKPLGREGKGSEGKQSTKSGTKKNSYEIMKKSHLAGKGREGK